MTMTTGFLFPGQGSQAIGMVGEVAEQHACVRDTFASASEAVGFDLWDLVANGPEAELNRTVNTQPALLTASVALWRVWTARGGVQPHLAAGHSLGEYSALVAAQALALGDAVRLVRARGELMQQAVPEGQGAMAAILGLEDTVVERCCSESAGAEVVSCANYNAPGQAVIAGHAAAVERAGQACRAAGAKRVMPLAVSVPSHCALMASVAPAFEEELAQVEFSAPRFPIVQNVDARASQDPARIRSNLLAQLQAPVLWTACVRAMLDDGVERFVECGPGKVLSGLVKRIDRSAASVGLERPDDLDAAAYGTA